MTVINPLTGNDERLGRFDAEGGIAVRPSVDVFGGRLELRTPPNTLALSSSVFVALPNRPLTADESEALNAFISQHKTSPDQPTESGKAKRG